MRKTYTNINAWYGIRCRYIKAHPETDNYIDVVNMKIVLNSYKTVNAMGRREFTIAKEVENEVKRMVARRQEKGVEYLFAKMNGNKFEESEFSNAMIHGMEKYLGKRIGTQMHRKIHVSEERRGDLSQVRKKLLSDRMLHSTRMQERYRRLS